MRGIGLIYAVAFLILVRQGPALLGGHGILPAARFLDLVAEHTGSRGAGFWELPSLFWISASDTCSLLGKHFVFGLPNTKCVRALPALPDSL